jgi:hypothetical protein
MMVYASARDYMPGNSNFEIGISKLEIEILMNDIPQA